MYWCTGAAEEEVWQGFFLFVTTVWCVCSFPASGSVRMPTHHHLPEIRTSWVCRVEQEEIKTGGTGRVWGRRVNARRRRRSLNRKRERGREICPWACFVLCLTHTLSFLFKPLQLAHINQPVLHYILSYSYCCWSFCGTWTLYKGNMEVNLNDSGGHQPNIIKPMPLVCL